MYNVVSFSGGKDSTALVLLMIEKNYPIDEIIFCDTGVEFPKMYEHIDKVENYIGRKITKLKAEHSFEYMMFNHIKVKGKNKGKKGYGWSDFKNRWCTSYLKKDVAKRYLRQYNDVVEYHGIAVDEEHRANKNKEKIVKYPLIEWNMTENDCLKYCYSKGFDWGGLYEKFNRVSCYLCPLQRLSELKIIYCEYPELWKKMKDMDERNIEQFGRKFRSDYSIEELEEKFNKERRYFNFNKQKL